MGLLIEIKKWEEITSGKILEKLLTYTEDTNIFPSDDQVKAAVLEKALINKYSKHTQTEFIYYDLDQKNLNKNQNEYNF